MKKILFLLSAVISTAAFSQNLDPTKLFTLDYDVPPRTQDYVNASGFFIEMSHTSSFEIKRAVENEVNPHFYKIVSDRSIADVTLQLNSVVNNSSSKRYSSTSSERTDSKGNKYMETKHKFEGTYKYQVMIEMYNAKGEKVKSVMETSSSTIVGESTNKNSADSDYETKRNNEENSHLINLAKKCFYAIESDFFFALENVTITPIKVKSKKFDYADMNEAATLVTSWLESKNYSLDDENIKKAIATYETLLQELNTEEKKVKVNSEIGAVCNYMLSFINFAAKNYAKAQELIVRSEELDKRIHFTQEMLKDTCQKLKDKKGF